MARVQINIRSEDTLRDQLTNIAQEKNISLNELVVQTLADFVDTYALERVADDAIPSRTQVEAALGGIKAEILARCRNRVKYALNSMIQSARNHIFVSLFENEDDLLDSIKREISNDISRELQQLGYFVFIFTHYYDAENEGFIHYERPPFYFAPFDIAITLNEEDLSFYKAIQLQHS